MTVHPEVLTPETPQQLQGVFERLRSAVNPLHDLPLTHLLKVLERLSEAWHPDSENFRQATRMLDGIFSQHALHSALEALAMSLHPIHVEGALSAEFGRADLMDRWNSADMGAGHVRGFPLGVVTQILAGNVFLNGVIGLAQCLLSRNAAVLKLSSRDAGLTRIFARSLHDADPDGRISDAFQLCSWSGSADAFNDVARRESDAIVVWGGAEAVASYPREECRGEIVHHGPRLGLGFVLTGADIENSVSEIAWDIGLWEQQACSSPRILFVEDSDGTGQWPLRVAETLHAALSSIRGTLEPPPMTLDDKTEVRSIRELADWRSDSRLLAESHSFDHTVILLDSMPDEVPIGHRTVVVVGFQNRCEVPAILRRFEGGLQTAILSGPAHEWPEFVATLIRNGLSQVTAPGSAASRFLGLPHEGNYSLRRLIRMGAVDLGAGPLSSSGRDMSECRQISQSLTTEEPGTN